jgi:hypothetical protein
MEMLFEKPGVLGVLDLLATHGPDQTRASRITQREIADEAVPRHGREGGPLLQPGCQ